MRNKIGSNMYEENINGVSILYSYATPVACRGRYCFKTETNFSKTTSSHINKWGAKNFETKSQDYFDNLEWSLRNEN